MTAPARKEWKSPAERARTLGSDAPRLRTGIDTLDEWCRGGLVPSRVLGLIGAPNAGKTMFAEQLARRFSDAGHPVCVLAFDESADAALVRWGQSIGLHRDMLECGNAQTRDALVTHIETRALLIVDGDEHEELTIEEGALRLSELVTTLPGVLVVDSIQTARVRAHDTKMEMTERRRVDLVMAALRRVAKVHNLLVIATSEAGRNQYVGGSNQPKPSSLGAGKESGGIEFKLDTQVVLSSIKGASDLVEVFVPKNRIGKRELEEAAFRMRIERMSATFSEDVHEAHEDREEPDTTAQDANDVVEAVRAANGKITSQRVLRDFLRGMRNTRKASAIAYAFVQGWLEGGNGKPIVVTDKAPIYRAQVTPAEDFGGF